MKYILDTCVISETVRRSPDERALNWLNLQREEDLYLSVLTIGELHKGIARLDDSRRKKKLREWLERDLKSRFGARLLAVDAETASEWGKIQALAEKTGRRMPVIDGLIAATAIHHDIAVATRNSSDMTASGVTIIDPWE